ncbi:MAG: Uma2 family endonuclease [Oribacterium sp.]|jgi:Uma2 family endonuclease|nr:Uma2 family endonuclease [Oribacterium sp.]MDY6308903.1 Uma2 family endonuclease [Oribacterium sp.]MDY6315768.1 Uma2 family endonuclease [Oribacterium sp.]
MTLEEMKQKKKEYGYSLETLSKLSDVPLSTLKKLFSGATDSPRQVTIEKLTAVLDRKPQKHDYAAGTSGTELKEKSITYGSNALKPDESFSGKKQGEYTIEDYFALPEDERYELIDGVLFKMDSPGSMHQDVVSYLCYRLMACALEHGMPCHPFVAPFDVQLDKDMKTMVQPDVLVCCDHDQISGGGRVFGAPEFVAEVISPSSRQKDAFLKLNKYRAAGVKEYWLIDPKKQSVIVYLFYKDDDITTYHFDDTIPVSISDGLCEICFTPIKGWLEEDQKQKKE